MFEKETWIKLYFLYRILIFFFFLIIVAYSKIAVSQHITLIFTFYFLTAVLSFKIRNSIFQLFSLFFDIGFVYFVSYLTSFNALLLLSVVPLFASCMFVEFKFAVFLLILSLAFVFMSSDINIFFAAISYTSSFFSSYLLMKFIKEKKTFRQRQRFEDEFKDKLFIARKLSMEFAHEIRNPLMSISGAFEILKDNSLSSDDKVKKKMTKIIENEIDRANILTRDFLNLESDINLRKTDVDFPKMIDRIKEQAQIRYDGINISCECRKGSRSRSEHIYADEEKMERVFLNLIQNSYEAHARNIDIQIENKNGEFLVKIRDDGEGIDYRDREKIFMPFYTTKNLGTGLGLSICKRIIEAHDGTMELLDEKTFLIKIKKGDENG